MNRLGLILALAAFGTFSGVAADITFDTVGTELCLGANGCGTSSVTLDSAIISYLPNTGNTVSGPTFVNLGRLVVSCVDGGTSCGVNVLPPDLTLYLRVDETAPGVSSGFFLGGLISGSITGASSAAMISWDLNSSYTSASGTTYSVANPMLALAPPINNNCGSACSTTPSGLTTIQGFVNTVPEPSTILMLLTGIGFFAVGKLRR